MATQYYQPGEGMVEIVNAKVDLVHAPGDGGWYLQEYVDNADNLRISECYPTRDGALAAYDSGQVRW